MERSDVGVSGVEEEESEGGVVEGEPDVGGCHSFRLGVEGEPEGGFEVSAGVEVEGSGAGDVEGVAVEGPDCVGSPAYWSWAEFPWAKAVVAKIATTRAAASVMMTNGPMNLEDNLMRLMTLLLLVT